MSIDPKELAAAAVDAIAKQLGVNLNVDQVLDLAGKAVVHIGDLVSAKAWQAAKSAGDAAAAQVTTLEQAEESAKKAR